MQNKLRAAFRYHMRNARPPFWHVEGYLSPVGHHSPGHGIAVEAMKRARADVEAGTRRYPNPVRSMHRTTEADGLRYIGRVVPETNRQVFDKRGDCGWHTDSFGDVFRDGSGLCFGVVYQLPGRKGESRFVAGYEFGGVDGGPTLDLTRVFTEPRGGDSYWVAHGDKDDIPTLREAARHADALAKGAAETERTYQTAWRAGSQWAQEKETAEHARKEARELLAERRRMIRGEAWTEGAGPELPAICRAIRGQVIDALQTIRDARERMAELAAGDCGELFFYPDETTRAAFAEGAGT